MKRNLKLIVEILKDLESRKTIEAVTNQNIYVEGFSQRETYYNLELMKDAGLIEATKYDSKLSPFISVHKITWQGHDFLDAARNDTVWNKAEEQAKQQGQKLNELPFEVAKALLIAATKQFFRMDGGSTS
ncbi:DUF2513 domain-containing protein [Halobacillus litoralis]|uniref:DUF2513 domain-containing protein n=1 Tax=Halobacillus litoralis TaxID=45668 RepID=UPI001CD32D9F|nr:DUF2513 domain-containing protein [Halobacillus litoralis]MCA1021788.1 DUF2513 domain-containing protein [Halobacillus litoralis]